MFGGSRAQGAVPPGYVRPADTVKYAQIPTTEHDTAEHDALALDAARESIVLLKNDGLLPLDKSKYKRIAVFGINATNFDVLVGEYNGYPSPGHTTPSSPASPGRWDQRRAPELCGRRNNLQIVDAAGCSVALLTGQNENYLSERKARSNAARHREGRGPGHFRGRHQPAAGKRIAGRAMEGFLRGDRTRIELPATQTALLKDLKATGKPLVFVNCSGSAIAMPWEAENLSAIVQAWYPGQEGGTRRGGSPVRRREPRRTAPGHLLPFHRGFAGLHELRHGQPHLPLFHRQAPVRLRPRPELHHIRL